MYEVAVLFIVAIFASIAREIYGNKGVFVLPKVTEKGLVLGSLLAIVAAIFAVLMNYALIANEISLAVAISLGLSWGIAAPDIAANILGQFRERS